MTKEEYFEIIRQISAMDEQLASLHEKLWVELTPLAKEYVELTEFDKTVDEESYSLDDYDEKFIMFDRSESCYSLRLPVDFLSEEYRKEMYEKRKLIDTEKEQAKMVGVMKARERRYKTYLEMKKEFGNVDNDNC